MMGYKIIIYPTGWSMQRLRPLDDRGGHGRLYLPERPFVARDVLRQGRQELLCVHGVGYDPGLDPRGLLPGNEHGEVEYELVLVVHYVRYVRIHAALDLG